MGLALGAFISITQRTALEFITTGQALLTVGVVTILAFGAPIVVTVLTSRDFCTAVAGSIFDEVMVFTTGASDTV